jgi:hypothetical protein
MKDGGLFSTSWWALAPEKNEANTSDEMKKLVMIRMYRIQQTKADDEGQFWNIYDENKND